MAQLSLFNASYRYIIDSSSIFAQKQSDALPRRVHRSLWEKIETYMLDKIIVTCSEIEEEVENDNEVGNWLRLSQCDIISISNDIQRNVRKIVTENPNLIDFSAKNGSSSGDAFLIGTAMDYGLIIITEEKKTKKNKIPMICQQYGIETINLTELCVKENWSF